MYVQRCLLLTGSTLYKPPAVGMCVCWGGGGGGGAEVSTPDWLYIVQTSCCWYVLVRGGGVCAEMSTPDWLYIVQA